MNSPVDSIVLGGIDAFLPARDADKKFLIAVNDKVREAISDKDIKSLAQIGKSLIGIGQVTGIAFSEFIYTVEAVWQELKQKQDFYAWAEEQFAREETTLKRHINIWGMFVSGDIPKEYVDKFKTMPIRVLIPISTLWAKGKYEISDHQWKKLSNAPDPTTVNKLVREIKGTQPKKNSISIEWHRKEKQLIAWNQDKPSYIGLLYDEKDEIAVAALERLFSDKVLEK